MQRVNSIPLPIKLIVAIVAAFSMSPYLSYQIKAIFYTFSNFLIELVISILPLLIFSFIYKAIFNLSGKSFLTVATVFGLITLSNFWAIVVAITSFLTLSSLVSFTKLSAAEPLLKSSELFPLFKLNLKELFSPLQAMSMGFLLAVLNKKFKLAPTVQNLAHSAATLTYQFVQFFLQKIFIPLLPIYIYGFALKMSHENEIGSLIDGFKSVLSTGFILVSLNIIIYYFLASSNNWQKTLKAIKNLFPAALTGFSTMSSVATIAVSLKCAEKNEVKPEVAELTVPTTANSHLLSDNIIITMSALAMIKIYDLPFPSSLTLLLFTLSYCLAALSCAGVPGGTILIILPLLKAFFNFTPEMLSLMTAIYMIQDPIGTALNVTANGGLLLIVQKIYNYKLIETRS